MAHLFIISPNHDLLDDVDYTVEAEYGDRCVQGKIGTLAHHGSRSMNPPPCTEENNVFGIVKEDSVFGLSHFDLDCFGGILAILGMKPEDNEFWNLAGFIDVNGAHKINKANASVEAISKIYAWWAYAKTFRYVPPKDGILGIPEDEIFKHLQVLKTILTGDHFSCVWIEKGQNLKEDEFALNQKSFIESSKSGVIARVSPDFVNHLYQTPNGEKVAHCVVAYNTKFGSVTISFAEDGEFSARDIIQQIFPEKDDKGNYLAGGHKGIAGSPRGKRCSLAEFLVAFSTCSEMLRHWGD